jgi:hypothetical protein
LPVFRPEFTTEENWHLFNKSQSKWTLLHDTIAGAAEAIQMLHMGPMGDVLMCNQLLQGH